MMETCVFNLSFFVSGGDYPQSAIFSRTDGARDVDLEIKPVTNKCRWRKMKGFELLSKTASSNIV